MPHLFTGRRLLILAVLAAAAFLSYHFIPHGDRGPRPEMTSPVRTAKALAQDVPHYLQGLGTVQPYSDVLVTSRVEGHLMAIHFTEGQRVRAGDLLAEIDPRPYKAALSKAKGTLAQDSAELANARTDRDRYAGLVKKDFVARQTYDTQAAKVRQLEGTVAADKASVESAALDLAYSRITAPVSGKLGLKNYDVGALITANDSTGLVRITEVTPCYVLFTLPERDIPLVTKALYEAGTASGGSAKLPVEAWSRDQKERLAEGSLLTVDNRIDTSTGTVRLKAVFPNDSETLYPNEFVNARLRVRVLKNAVTVPPSAVQLGSDGSFVFVVDDSGTARRREVKTGLSTGAITVIESGLSAGETIVMDGVDRLRDGSKVRVAATAETVRLADNNSPLATESGPDETKDSAAAQDAKNAEHPSGKGKPSEKPVRP